MMMMTWRSSQLMALPMIVGCSAAPSVDVARERATIDSLLANHADALKRKDLETALSLYSDSPVIRPNHAEPITSRDGLRQLFTSWFASM